jgi:hypothetical protein
LIVAVTVFSAALSGCVINVSDEGDFSDRSVQRQQRHNREVISGLRLGVTVEHVRAELGEPDFSEAWTERDEEVRVLRYRTHRANADGDTTIDETTALVFRSGKLIGVGERAVADN